MFRQELQTLYSLYISEPLYYDCLSNKQLEFILPTKDSTSNVAVVLQALTFIRAVP